MKKVVRKLVISLFHSLQNVGVNVLPNHFYSNTPSFKFLSEQKFWKEPMSMTGVNGTDIGGQIEFTKKCVNSVHDKTILANFEIIKTSIKQQNESGYGVVEADYLYCFIHHVKPKKVVQIGCGVSTSIILRAGNSAKHPMKITCIEPFPSPYLKELAEKKEIRLLADIAQTVPLEVFTELEAGDFLFVDSTHTVKAGSEVNRIILEILPRLKKGVLVHFHDIFFPFDYQRDLETTLHFWEESTLLHAFLVQNDHYTILASQSMLHYHAKNEMKELFPNYNPQNDVFGLPVEKDYYNFHFPSSLYLQVI